MIDDAEQEKRRALIASAKASVGLEGFVISREMEELSQRFIDGEIDLQELIAEYKDRHK